MTNAEAWDYAIGMIRVDGLEPTEDLKKYIEKEKTGEATMEDVKKFLDKKYKMKEPETNCQGLFHQIHKKSTKKVPEAPYGS